MKHKLIKWLFLAITTIKLSSAYDRKFTLSNRLKEVLSRGLGNNIRTLNTRWSLRPLDVIKPKSLRYKDGYFTDNVGPSWPNWGSLVSQEKSDTNVKWSNFPLGEGNSAQKQADKPTQITKLDGKSQWKDISSGFHTGIFAEIDDTDQDPNNVNLNEIFSNKISVLPDDPLTSMDNDLHLPPSQYAEFRLITYTSRPSTPPPTSPPPRTTPPTTPAPRRSKRRADARLLDAPHIPQEDTRSSSDRYLYLIYKPTTTSTSTSSPKANNKNSVVAELYKTKSRFIRPAYLSEDESTSSENPTSTTTSTSSTTTSTTTTTTPSTTTTPTTSTGTSEGTNVVPLKNYQRGVLDLILPAARVKNFRDVFESVRRLLSYTFKK